jgi:hypothetical protein
MTYEITLVPKSWFGWIGTRPALLTTGKVIVVCSRSSLLSFVLAAVMRLTRWYRRRKNSIN